MLKYFSPFSLILLICTISLIDSNWAYAQKNIPDISLNTYNAKLCPESTTSVKASISGQMPIHLTYIDLESYGLQEIRAVSNSTPLILEFSNSGSFQIINYGNRNFQVDTNINFKVENTPNPTARLLGGGQFCENEGINPIEIVLTGTPPWELTYQENYGNALFAGINESNYMIYDKEGTINIRNIKDKFCSIQVLDTAVISIHEIPEITPLRGEQEVCPGWDAIYQTSFSDKYVYNWHVPLGGNIDLEVEHTANQVPVTWIEAGSYNIELVVSTPNTGCNTGKIIYPVEVLSPPKVKENFNTITCFDTGEYIELSPGQTPENSIYWPHLDETSSSARIYEQGWYYYVESIPLGCADTGSIRIVNKCIPEVYVPEAFTPNNDQINDKLEVFGVFYNLELQIYNLNGELVHVMRNIEAAWDGTKDGQEMPNGTYLWKATFTDKLEEMYTSEGQVILIR